MSWRDDDTFLAKWLKGELSQHEKTAFESTEEGKEFQDLINASTLVDVPKLNVDSGFDKFQAQIDQYESTETAAKIKPWIWLSMAASISLIAVLTYIFAWATTVKTGHGEQQIVDLPGGSIVHLNVASKLSYQDRNWEKERRLELEGEGFFDVKSGVSFSVETQVGTVNVLGTSFNVRSRNNKLDVTCYSGKVEVVAGGRVVPLDPGQTIRFEDQVMIELKKDEGERPAWLTGISKLEDVALKDVLDELSFVFDIEVKIDREVDGLIYTGAFPNDDLATALELVFEPMGVKYEYNGNTKTLTVLVDE